MKNHRIFLVEHFKVLQLLNGSSGIIQGVKFGKQRVANWHHPLGAPSCTNRHQSPVEHQANHVVLHNGGTQVANADDLCFDYKFIKLFQIQTVDGFGGSCGFSSASCPCSWLRVDDCDPLPDSGFPRKPWLLVSRKPLLLSRPRLLVDSPRLVTTLLFSPPNAPKLLPRCG